MFDRLRQQFRAFTQQPSGTRFEHRYRLRQNRPHRLRSVVTVGAGCLLILFGIVMLVLPGPGLIAIVIGAGMIGGESLLAARLFDRVDRRGTAIYARWRNRKR
jgi:hypothetical protein